MQLLQGMNVHLTPLKRRDAFRRSTRRCQSGNRWDTGGYRRSSDCFLVEPRLLAGRSVHYELNPLAFDKVDDVGTSLFHLVDTLDVHAGGLDHVGSTSGGHQLKS